MQNIAKMCERILSALYIYLRASGAIQGRHNPLVFVFVTGSENNSLYIYYKGLSKQLLTYKFDTVRSVLVSN